MNTRIDHDPAPELDAPLASLPDWQPPADFAARLAAAAARQAVAAPVAPPVPLWVRWLEHITRLTPTAVGAGLLALALASVPWMQVATHPAFPLLIALGAATTGLVLTWRLLRAP